MTSQEFTVYNDLTPCIDTYLQKTLLDASWSCYVNLIKPFSYRQQKVNAIENVCKSKYMIKSADDLVVSV